MSRFETAMACLALGLACARVPAPGSEHTAAAARYAEQGRLAEAARAIDIGVRMHPDDAGLRREAARLLERAGSPERAAVHLEAATRLAPGDVATWLALSELESRRGNRDGAYVAARRAVTLAPDDPEALGVFARAADAAGLPNEARAARWRLEELASPPAALDAE